MTSALPVVDARPPVVAWQQALRQSIRTKEALAAHLTLNADEAAGLDALAQSGGLPLGITPHYLSLIDPNDPNDPLRLQVVPRAHEFAPASWDRRDPLGEEDHEAVPFLVHRYPDRVLLLATDRCASYCRFCTRKRFVGQGPTPTLDHLAQALDYISTHDAIREVIVSGGDALILSDDRLRGLLATLRTMPHLDVIRIATRVPVFLPERIDAALAETLRTPPGAAATYVLTHFNHPRELCRESLRGIATLVDAGVPVLNQTVLLRGVNADAATLTTLFRMLTRARARPYYLHQCDLAPGTEPFRVPLDEARALYSNLRGHVSGLSLPTFVVDIPGGLGKVPMNLVPIVSEDDDSVTLKGFDGATARYPRHGTVASR